jgi:regulator of sigma E protease
MSIDLVRAGHPFTLAVTPKTVDIETVQGGKQPIGQLGVQLPRSTVIRVNPIEAVSLATKKTWDTAGTTLFVIGRLVTGQVNPNQLSGFLGIAHASGEVTKQAVSDAEKSHVPLVASVAFSLIQVTALLSVSVGLLNLMPVPVLDGGHLVFYAYEAIARRPLSAGIQAVGYRVGLALLLGLMLFAGWNDLQRLRVFHFLGGLIS